MSLVKKWILICLLSVTAIQGSGQISYTQTETFLKANSFWAWYNQNGWDFSSGSPVHTPTSLLPQSIRESVATASDPRTGSLLFYTDGIQVWNRNHVLMPNGSNLIGNNYGTTRQGSCIVPVIGDSTRFYIFVLGSVQSDTLGLYYNIVDMTLNGGDGDILSNFKNIPIDTLSIFSEAMIAIPGNNCNVWLLTHEYKSVAEGGSNRYLAFEITENGINTSPIVSHGECDTISSLSYLSVSPDRKKIAFMGFSPSNSHFSSHAISEVAKFNADNGMVYDGVKIEAEVTTDPMTLITHSLAEFSPNGERLYIIKTRTNPRPIMNVLSQYDLAMWNSAAINNSQVIIDTLPISANMDSYGANLRAYNDTMYTFYGGNHLIGKIQSPDELGTSCDFDADAMQLPLPYKTSAMVNHMSNLAYPFSSATTIWDTAMCGELLLRPSLPVEAQKYLWNSGSNDSTFLASSTGSYWVNYTYFSNNCIYSQTDTFHIGQGEIELNPTITQNVDTLGTFHPYATYQWLKNEVPIPGAVNRYLTVTENGLYQVVVSDETGCNDTSDVYEVTNKSSSIRLRPSDSRIMVWPNPTRGTITIADKDFASYQIYHIDGRMLSKGYTLKANIGALSSGIYFIELRNKAGVLYYRTKIIKH